MKSIFGQNGWTQLPDEVYSLLDTAKVNRLNIYECLKNLFTEIPKHVDDTRLTFQDGLLH